MKRTVALILTICMMLGTVVSVSAAPSASFTKTLNLVRLIRMMFKADEDEGPSIGKLEDGILTVYVSEKGKSDANGTEKNPFGTITTARDAIRTLDKSEFDGINVIIKAGTYSITEPIVFTAEDNGTKDCPITYLGEEGVTIVGGVAFSAADFAPATGTATKYFPEPDKIVQIDLGKFGFTPEDIAKYMENGRYYSSHPFLTANGVRQTICQYPDNTWIVIDDGHWLDSNGNETAHEDWDSSVDEEYRAAATLVNYGKEHFDRVQSWTSDSIRFFHGHLRFLWADTLGPVAKFDTATPTFTANTVGYDPIPGGLVYFYNIPEELTIPGEYYIDTNAILYYYPTEEFDSAVFTLPVSKDIFRFYV